jgi:protein-S-isoprenylcysteine O-methyltransferase Ste14
VFRAAQMTVWWLAFLAGVALLAYASRSSFRRPFNYGFYRFWAFTSLLALVLISAEAWFDQPATPRQLLSWCLLTGSVALAAQGFVLLRRRGRPKGSIEATTLLVSSGIYRRIRHPLYASLLCFAWGVVLKNPTMASALLGLGVSGTLYLAARTEERESRLKFGPAYEAYIERTRMFIPFVF